MLRQIHRSSNDILNSEEEKKGLIDEKTLLKNQSQGYQQGHDTPPSYFDTQLGRKKISREKVRKEKGN